MGTLGAVIASAGVITPIGLSLAETAASARARVARLREIEWRDRRFEPFIVGTVPDEGLPELSLSLADQPLQYRETRMLRMAHAALEEALAPIVAFGERVPLLLGLPEHHTAVPIDPRTFLRRLDEQMPDVVDLASSVAVARGRAAGVMALREACSRLARADSQFVLVGGVDCLVDLYVMSTLDFEGRVRNEINSDGFTPSEGAAFLLLTTADVASQQNLVPLASVLGVSQGHEAGHLYSEEKYLGEGLSSVFESLLTEAPPPPIRTVYSSFNGERYWAREFGVARLRHSQVFSPDHAMEHPAECFGDLGAAHGSALAALAAHAVKYGYRETSCLVYASSDRGDRAASLLAHAA